MAFRRCHKRLKKVHDQALLRAAQKKCGDMHEKLRMLEDTIFSSSACICDLENETQQRQEEIDGFQTGMFAKLSKSYSSDTRLFEYDAIINQVPTANIATLLRKFAMRCGQVVDNVPHRNTVEMMGQELGVIAEHSHCRCHSGE